MDQQIDVEALQKTIFEVQDEIAKILRAFAHKKRLEILGLLLNGSKEFNDLLQTTDISKTALAKHLALLLDKSLVERKERGSYELTSDGQEMLLAIVKSYRSSEARALSIRKRLWREYTPDLNKQPLVESESFSVKNKAFFEPGWQTFVRACAGILKSLDQMIDVIDVSGYLGQAFHINVAKGLTCPSSTTRHNAWEYFLEGVKVLGWELGIQSDLGSYPGENTVENRERSLKFFAQVKEALKRANRPVIVWGIPIPEYGVVNGYFEDKYDVSTFLSDGNHLFGSEKPIRYDQLKAPTRLVVFSFEKPVNIPKNKDQQTIKRICTLLKGENPREGYVLGLEAFNEWAKVLEGDLEYISYHGNSYLGEFTLEQVNHGQIFLQRLYQKYKGKPQAQFFQAAQKEYMSIWNNMKNFQAIFPFAFDGDLILEKRKKGSNLLRLNSSHLKRTLEALQTGLEVWE